MGAGAGSNPLWALVWLVILVFVAFIVAGFCAGLYIFLSLFTPCIPALTQVTDFLMKGIMFVNTCSSNMISMKPLC
jgi:hypothetical protein